MRHMKCPKCGTTMAASQSAEHTQCRVCGSGFRVRKLPVWTIPPTSAEKPEPELPSNPFMNEPNPPARPATRPRPPCDETAFPHVNGRPYPPPPTEQAVTPPPGRLPQGVPPSPPEWPPEQPPEPIPEPPPGPFSPPEPASSEVGATELNAPVAPFAPELPIAYAAEPAQPPPPTPAPTPTMAFDIGLPAPAPLPPRRKPAPDKAARGVAISVGVIVMLGVGAIVAWISYTRLRPMVAATPAPTRGALRTPAPPVTPLPRRPLIDPAEALPTARPAASPTPEPTSEPNPAGGGAIEVPADTVSILRTGDANLPGRNYLVGHVKSNDARIARLVRVKARLFNKSGAEYSTEAVGEDGKAKPIEFTVGLLLAGGSVRFCIDVGEAPVDDFVLDKTRFEFAPQWAPKGSRPVDIAPASIRYVKGGDVAEPDRIECRLSHPGPGSLYNVRLWVDMSNSLGIAVNLHSEPSEFSVNSGIEVKPNETVRVSQEIAHSDASGAEPKLELRAYGEPFDVKSP